MGGRQQQWSGEKWEEDDNNYGGEQGKEVENREKGRT